MQRCICTVRLGGNLGSTSELVGVSPAEVLVLRHVHGDDAVLGFRPAGNDRGQSVNEKDRLSVKYRGAFKEVFPGAAPQLPDTFKAIGVDLYGDDDTAVAPAKAAKPGRKKAGAVDPNPDSGTAPASATEAVTAGDLPGADDAPGAQE